MKEHLLKNIDETVRLGVALGGLISKGDIIALTGDLGSGKTTLVKGIAKGLGVKDSKHVNSPSFVIVKEYEGRIPLYHFDVYRLNDPAGLDTVGYREFFYGDGVTVIEWADKIKKLLPDEYLKIELTVKDEKEREIKIAPYGDRYANLLKRLKL